MCKDSVNTVMKVAYLLGVAEEAMTVRYREQYNKTELASAPGAEVIRAYARARQTVLFHLTCGPKIFSLPDSVRSYCPDGVFSELRTIYSDVCTPEGFINRMTEEIVKLLPEALAALSIQHRQIIIDFLFKWPVQNKKSAVDLSKQYHNKKYSFPLQAFIPKPHSFSTSLSKLLDSDENLWSAPPIQLAIGRDADKDEPAEQETPAEVTQRAAVTVIDRPFRPEMIEWDGEGLQVNYVDLDNVSETIVSRLCASSSQTNLVKIFYDDRTRRQLALFENMPYVDLIFVERLRSIKSLVDSAILTEAVADLYTLHVNHGVLYSSDSDYFSLALKFYNYGAAFSVVGTEDKMCDTYAEAVSKYARCYSLTENASVPVIDGTIIEKLLIGQLTSVPIGTLSVRDIVNYILENTVERRYHPLLTKEVEDIVESMLKKSHIETNKGLLRVTLAS